MRNFFKAARAISPEEALLLRIQRTRNTGHPDMVITKFDSIISTKFKLLKDKPSVSNCSTWEDVTSNYDLISSFKTFFYTIDKCFEESFSEKTASS